MTQNYAFNKVERVLHDVYGVAPYALVQQVLDTYYQFVNDSNRDLEREVSNVIWNWFPGGDTAYSAGNLVLDELRG